MRMRRIGSTRTFAVDDKMGSFLLERYAGRFEQAVVEKSKPDIPHVNIGPTIVSERVREMTRAREKSRAEQLREKIEAERERKKQYKDMQRRVT